MGTRIIITRTSYCPKCHSHERPKTDDVYVVHGSHGYHVHQIEYAIPRYNPKGFVPTIFELKKAIDGFVYGTKTCCMDGCGYDIRNNPAHENDATRPPYILGILHTEEFRMRVEDWNALVLTKDLGYKVE